MQKEAQEYVEKCDQCQWFVPNIHQLGGILNPLFSPWPFAQWGLNIVGPFPKAMGNKKYLLVNTNYFTKWVEAKHRYSIWGSSCAHLGQRPSVRQKTFGSYCGELGITNRYSTPVYPQGDG